ncbi:hypothetical protein JHK87_044595 [Glycine soja]|nr:hypothetical protein JHK87_044595 [Glycine soja]
MLEAQYLRPFHSISRWTPRGGAWSLELLVGGRLVKNTWTVSLMVLWLRQVISKPRHVWCYGQNTREKVFTKYSFEVAFVEDNEHMLGDFKFECPKLEKVLDKKKLYRTKEKKGLTSSWED